MCLIVCDWMQCNKCLKFTFTSFEVSTICTAKIVHEHFANQDIKTEEQFEEDF